MRHFGLRGAIRVSRAKEHLDGWRAGLLWTPRVFRAWKAGVFRSSRLRKHRAAPSSLPKILNFPVFYINLDHRQDRNYETLAEFEMMRVLDPLRVSAIRDENGALGCARSHIAVLETLRQREFEMAMICEDDVEFLVSRERLDRVLRDFMNRDGVGVLCLANRVRGPRFRISSSLAVANNVQMAACYMVKRSSLEPLLESFLESARGLSQGGGPNEFAIDQKWKELQTGVIFFAVPRRQIARQRESYSDIEKRVKFYD